MLRSIAIVYFASYTGALCADAEIHREATLTRLGIEGDLSKLSESHYRTWNAEQDCEVNADEAFEQAVASAQLDRELTTEERAKFKERFVQEMLQDCKDDPEIASHWKNDVAQALENDKPAVTEALVKHINEGGSSWTAGSDPEHLSSAMLKKKCGYDGSADTSDHLDIASEEINLQSGPASYNTADKISQCSEVITKVHNQGTCGSCWVFGALGALDGRLCLLSNGAFSGQRAMMSRSYGASCCPNRQDGCQGGFPEDVYKLLGSGGGIPLGGDKGCIPYFGSGSGADHFNSKSRAPPCMSSCKTPGYPRGMEADKIKMPGMTGGRVGPWIAGDSWQHSDAFGRKELYTNGPIPIAVLVDSRFQSYKSGIYKNGCKSKTANHVTTAYGYTPDMFQTTNSWGYGWGRRGYIDMGNCEIALWCVPKGTVFPDGYGLPGGNPPSPPPPGPPPAPPGPPPAPPHPDGWALDANGVWTQGQQGPSPPPPPPPPPPPARPLENAGKACWIPCGGQGGRCDYCGTDHGCCREGFASDPAICKKSESFSGNGGHECVWLPSPGEPVPPPPGPSPGPSPGPPPGPPPPPPAAPVQNAGKDCWVPCGNKGGRCDWCGTDNGCCAEGFASDPAICKQSASAFVLNGKHECVSLPGHR